MASQSHPGSGPGNERPRGLPLLLVCALVLPLGTTGCGSGGGRALGGLVARAAVNVAAAAISEATRKRRRRRRDPNADYVEEPGRLQVQEPFEVYELPVVSEAPGEPLPIAYELSPEELTCEADAECRRVESPACACDQGGAAVAAVASYEAAVAVRLDRATCDAEPSGLHASCAGEVRCHRGLCRIFAPRPVDVPEEPVPPAPVVPEGYGTEPSDPQRPPMTISAFSAAVMRRTIWAKAG